jgi:hypothetical protein
MQKDEVIVLALSKAVYCANCDALTNTNTAFCLNCESTALFNLAAILDRQPIQDAQLAEYFSA